MLPHPHAPVDIRAQLERVGVRVTAQRLKLAELLLGGPARHVSAEDIWGEARALDYAVSLATTYNTLNSFVEAGLLRVIELGGRSLFDTNATPHHHVLDERTGELRDLPADAVDVQVYAGALPKGADISAVEVLVRVRS